MAAEKLKAPTLDPPELPQPAWAAPRGRLRVTLSLRQIMLLTIYCAIVFVAGRSVYDTRAPAAEAILGLLVGLGFSYLGVWLAIRLRTLAILGWILFLVGYITATASMMGMLVIPAIPILIAVIIYLHTQQRRNQQNGLLWVLAVAADRDIPLAPGVEAYAQQNHGIFRDRTHALAATLQAGQTLSGAIKWVPRVVPWDAPLLIRVGEATGQLAHGLREAAETRAKRHESLRTVFGRVGYLVTIIALAQVIVAFTTYFIVPKFEAIFKDFGVDLPIATKVLILGSHWAVDYLGFILIGQFLLLAYVTFLLGGKGVQGIPVISRLFRVRHKSLIFRSLAMVVEANQPFEPILTTMAFEFPSNKMRRRLKKAVGLLRTGTDWITALEFVRILNAGEVGVLNAATRAGNLAWALRTLAETSERRFAYRLQIGSHLIFTIAILAMGAIVLFITVALFTPLVHLIERLSG